MDPRKNGRSRQLQLALRPNGRTRPQHPLYSVAQQPGRKNEGAVSAVFWGVMPFPHSPLVKKIAKNVEARCWDEK